MIAGGSKVERPRRRGRFLHAQINRVGSFKLVIREQEHYKFSLRAYVQQKHRLSVINF